MKKYNYFFIFLFFLIISILMPISGDDWGNYLIGKEGLHRMVGNAIGMYFDWEGRFVSRLLINLLTYHKWIFNIVISLLLTLFIYFISKLLPSKHSKFAGLLLFLSILCLDNKIFTQTILWVAGSITYLFPTLLTLIYIVVYFKYLRGKRNYSKWVYIISFLFSLAMPMFVENIAFSYVFLNGLLLIYEYIKYKRINKLLLMNCIISFVGAFLMLVSPGSAKRNELENENFNQLSFFNKLKTNYPNFIYYTYISNMFMLFLSTVSFILITQKAIWKKKSKIISYLFITIFPIINVVIYLLDLLKIDIGIFSNFINGNIWYIIIYWSIYLIYSIYLLWVYTKEKENKHLIFILLLTALSANIIMLLSPIYSSRTTLFTVLSLNIIFIYIITDLLSIKFQNLLYYILRPIVLIGCIVYLIAYYNLAQYQKHLEVSIKKQLATNSKQITVYTSPGYLSWGLTPTGDYHSKTFKMYYQIPEECELVYAEGAWRYFIFYVNK